MTSIEQDHEIERLSLANGGESLAVRDGFADGHVDVTNQRGRCWHVSDDGVARVSSTLVNFSINWGTRQLGHAMNRRATTIRLALLLLGVALLAPPAARARTAAAALRPAAAVRGYLLAEDRRIGIPHARVQVLRCRSRVCQSRTCARWIVGIKVDGRWQDVHGREWLYETDRVTRTGSVTAGPRFRIGGACR